LRGVKKRPQTLASHIFTAEKGRSSKTAAGLESRKCHGLLRLKGAKKEVGEGGKCLEHTQGDRGTKNGSNVGIQQELRGSAVGAVG